MPAPKLGKWHRSRAGVGAFGYKQAVRNLEKGSLYRVRVDYRWYDEDGEVIGAHAQALRELPRRDRAPNLRVRIAGVRKTPAAATDRYYLKVMNVGRASAEGVPVAAVGGRRRGRHRHGAGDLREGVEDRDRARARNARPGSARRSIPTG